VTEYFTRDRIIELLRELPADATIDDAIEKLLFVARIERGIAELDAGQGVPHDEVKRRLDELVAARGRDEQ
jgi:predicted transcriptional regulator